MQMTGSLAERAIAEWRDYLEIQREMTEQEERERRARRWGYVRRRLSILIAYLLDPYGDWHHRAEEASPPPSAAERLAEAVLDLLRERGLVPGEEP